MGFLPASAMPGDYRYPEGDFIYTSIKSIRPPPIVVLLPQRATKPTLSARNNPLDRQNFRNAIMDSRLYGFIRGCALAGLLWPVYALACDPDMDGCLGCSDTELPVCVDKLAAEICANGGGFEYCDKIKAEDDIERLVLRNTGIHMSRLRAMLRSAARYQRPHPRPH
jgi:hypothetical protein